MSGGMGMNGMGHGMGNPHNQGRMMGNQMISGMGQQMGHPGMMAPMGQMGHPQHQGHPQQMGGMMNQMGAHGIGIGQMMNHNQGQSHFNAMNQAMMNQPPGQMMNSMSQMQNPSQMGGPQQNPPHSQMGSTSLPGQQNMVQQQQMNLAQDQERNRFIAELEFVQCLANPSYLNFLAQEGYLKKPEFINYLKYLEYWKDPKYAKLIRYPTCLRFLEPLLDSHFREAIAMARNAKEIDDQILMAWNRRHRIRNERMQKAHARQEQNLTQNNKPA